MTPCLSTIRLPLALSLKASWAIPKTTSGYRPQQTSASARVEKTAPRSWEIKDFIQLKISYQVQSCDQEIDDLDPDKGKNNSAESIDEQVALEDCQRADWFVGHAAQCQGNQRDDDQRVENDGTENRARGTAQPHNIERSDRGECCHKHRRNDGKVFRDVVGDAERGQRAARSEERRVGK